MTFVAIQDFCQTGSGGTPSRAKAERYYGGTIPWVRSGELREGIITETSETITQEALDESSAKLVPSGALLVAMYGATIGRVAELGVDAATNQAVCHILPQKRAADRRYMFHALCSKADEWIGKGAGGAQPNISQGIIKETKIFLPPLPEQKRIAAILDKADEIRRKRAEAIKLTEELLRSAFLEMFGDPVTNPKGWEVKKLGEVCDVRDGTHDSPSYVDAGYPLVTSKNLRDGRIDLSDANLISQEDYESINKRSGVDRGDILMPMIGTVGNPVLVEEEPTFAIKNVALIKGKGTDVSQRYVNSLLSSHYFEHSLRGNKRGGTQKFVSLGDLRRLNVPLPPFGVQFEFERLFSCVSSAVAGLERLLNSSDSLAASLTQRAFRGEL